MKAGLMLLLQRAQERIAEMGELYRGDLLPAEAQRLVDEADATIVDVRSKAEWDWVGRVPGSVLVEWECFPGGRRNDAFIAQLEQRFRPDDFLLFLCRSGGRSRAAATAAAQAGFKRVYNVLEGFEGPLDHERHRGTRGGWRKAGLKWVQT